MPVRPRLRDRLPRRRALQLGAVAALSATVPGLASATTAAAAPGFVEVVSREWGTAGPSPYVIGLATAGVVSDNGRYVAFSGVRETSPGVKPGGEITDFGALQMVLYVRDVQLNRTYQLTSSTGFGDATAIDRSGRFISYEEAPAFISADQAVHPDLWIYDVVTQTRTLVGRASGARGSKATDAGGQITGDGKAVIFTARNVPGLGGGVFRRTLATGRTERIGNDPAVVGAAIPPSKVISVSDDGRSYSLMVPKEGGGRSGFVVTPDRRIATTDLAEVSPDGSTAAYLSKPQVEGAIVELVRIDLRTGAETRVAGPDGNVGGGFSGSAEVSWMNPDGKRIAVMPSTAGGSVFQAAFVAKLYDVAAGTWSEPGPFAESLAGTGFFNGAGRSAVSRSGRFAAFRPWDSDWAAQRTTAGIVVGDFWSQGLPGGADLPPANWYFQAFPTYCDAEGRPAQELRGFLTPKFLPKAATVRGVVKAGGKTVFDTTVSETSEAIVKYPAGATSSTIDITVTFPGGAKVTGSYPFTFYSRDANAGQGGWDCGV